MEGDQKKKRTEGRKEGKHEDEEGVKVAEGKHKEKKIIQMMDAKKEKQKDE